MKRIIKSSSVPQRYLFSLYSGKKFVNYSEGRALSFTGFNSEKDSIPLSDSVSSKLAANRKHHEEGNSYTVKKGDTLMKIAFLIHGDYRLWRGIYELNQEVLNKQDFLEIGTVLKIKKSSFSLNKSKDFPYFIKEGDTLSKISHKVYGDWKLWRELYMNNKLLINKPNLIFTGFTIYYSHLDKIRDDNEYLY